MPDEFMALDELTGLVHRYEGAGIGKPLSCGCEGFEEACKADSFRAIKRHHLERGVWEAADCLKGDSYE